MKNISIKAILIGLVALIILDELAATLLVFTLVGEISTESILGIQQDSTYLILRMFVGAIALIGAGYLVEKIAKKQVLINSGILGVISVILTVVLLGSDFPIWYLVLSYLYQWPSAIAGGYLANKQAGQK